MPIATLVRFPDKRVRVTEKGSKRERTRGGSESIGTRISAGRSGKGREGTVPWRGLNLRYDTHEAKSRRAAQSRLRLADEKSAPTSRDQLSARLRAERLYARTQPGTRIYDIVRRISQINFVFSRYLSLFRRCLFSERVKRISDLWQVTRNRISGDYRRDCQSSFQCGLLLWISHFAFSSKEFRVAGSIVSSYGESYDSLFLFIHLSAYLPRNRDRIFMRVKRSILRVSLYFAGFSCVRSRHEMRRNIFFSWTFVRRTGNNTKTFNSSGQLLPRKKKKLVRVMPVRWNTVNIVFGTWLIASYFLVTKISGIVPCLFIFLSSKWDIRGVLNRNLVYT